MQKLVTATPVLDDHTAPLPRVIDLPYRQRLRAIRQFHLGSEIARGTGPVAQFKLGPAWLGIPQLVFISSPRGAHDVLAGFDGTFDKEQIIHVQGRHLTGSNSFNMPHQPWQPRRRTLQPLFVKPKVCTYAGDMHTAATAQAQDWLARGEIDLDEAARRLTLDVLGRSILGLDLASRADEIGPRIRRVITYPTHRGTQPLRTPYWLPTRSRARFRVALAALRDLVTEAIERAREDPSHRAPLVRQLLAATDPDTGRPLTDDAIGNELLTFLIAGHDTTATTLAYALWQLARDPELQNRVAEEVAACGERPLTADDVASLPFTVQVLHESLRLCPPAAAVGRLAMRDAIVDGHLIKAGVNVIVCIYAIQRDPALWPDSLRFDPDRFEPTRAKAMDRWQFLPFGAGPRSCIGDHFALLEATLALATTLRQVRLTTEQADFPVAVPFTLVAAAPVHATITRR